MTGLRFQIDRALAGLLVVIMAVLVIDVLWQVFTRFALSDPSSFTEELARYLLIWLSLFGAASAAGRRLHLAVDLLPEHLSGVRRRRLGYVIGAAILVFSVLVMVVGGSRLVYVTLVLGQNSPALGIPLGWVYLAVPASGALIAFFAACDLLAEGRGATSASGQEWPAGPASPASGEPPGTGG